MKKPIIFKLTEINDLIDKWSCLERVTFRVNLKTHELQAYQTIDVKMGKLKNQAEFLIDYA